MNCKHCGKAISESDTICPACGTVTGNLQSSGQPRAEAGAGSPAAGEFWARMQNQQGQNFHPGYNPGYADAGQGQAASAAQDGQQGQSGAEGQHGQYGQYAQTGQTDPQGQYGQQSQYGSQARQSQYGQYAQAGQTDPQGQYGQQNQYGSQAQQGQFGQFGQQAWQKAQTTFGKPEGYGYGDPGYPAGFPRYDAAGHELSPKNRVVLSLLCAALGTLGIHRFYAGKIGTGILMLLTAGGLGIWWIIDLVFCCVGRFRDKEGRLIASY